MASAAAQPMSARTLWHGIAKERLTNGVRCASVAGVKTRPNTGGAVAGVVQPEPSVVLLSGVAGERLTSGVCSASVVGMSRELTRKSRGGGGSLT